MAKLMRCPYCGLLQDEPSGVKTCARCGGALEYESQPPGQKTYIQVQMELDQVAAPPDRNLERYLLVTVRTPREVPSEEAASTDAGRPPLNFTAVLDVSGSMRGEKLRLYRINAPEVRGPERPEGLKSRDFLREQIDGKQIIIQTVKDKKGKYGRYLADIWLPVDGDEMVNINDLLVEKGFAEYKDYG